MKEYTSYIVGGIDVAMDVQRLVDGIQAVWANFEFRRPFVGHTDSLSATNTFTTNTARKKTNNNNNNSYLDIPLVNQASPPRQG
jgi:hypothetical protein